MSQFYEDLLEYYDDIFPLEQERIDFIQSQVPLKQGIMRRILDVGCATGSTAIALIKNGYHVTGIDLNTVMIQSANRRNPEPKTDGIFLKMNMLEVSDYFPSESFDAVLCLGNTLVHLQDASEIEVFFKKVQKILKPGARFIFQVINYDLILDKDLTGLPDIVTSRYRFVRHYTPIPGESALRFSASLYSSSNHLVFKDETRLYPCRPSELKDLLQRAGFRGVSYFADFSRQTFDGTSIALVGFAENSTDQ